MEVVVEAGVGAERICPFGGARISEKISPALLVRTSDRSATANMARIIACSLLQYASQCKVPMLGVIDSRIDAPPVTMI